METGMVGKTQGPQTVFKSYYVVWKRIITMFVGNRGGSV